jgi:hypothetical protein
VVIGSGFLLAAPTHASTVSTPINVPCSGTNGGAASLVAAVNQANGTGGGTIVLAARCNYQLTGPAFTGANGADGLPPITTSVTIEGNDATISGNGNPFVVGSAYRIVEVNAPGNLSVANVTLQYGTGESGAGILNEGTATLAGTTITNNADGSPGGGIANSGHLDVIGSTISDNGVTTPASSTQVGGGIYNSGEATVSDSTITDNFDLYGGGIANFGQLTVSGTTIMSNLATSAPASHTTTYGGGLYNAGGTATLSSTVVTSNHAGGPDASSQGFGGGNYLAGGSVTLAGGAVVANTPDNCDPPGSVVGCAG